MTQILTLPEKYKVPAPLVGSPLADLKESLTNFERLRKLREYQTPITMRSFSRFAVGILCLTLAPYFAYLNDEYPDVRVMGYLLQGKPPGARPGLLMCPHPPITGVLTRAEACPSGSEGTDGDWRAIERSRYILLSGFPQCKSHIPPPSPAQYHPTAFSTHIQDLVASFSNLQHNTSRIVGTVSPSLHSITLPFPTLLSPGSVKAALACTPWCARLPWCTRLLC